MKIMSRVLSFLLLILMVNSNAVAQNCVPNDSIPDSLLGVFPRPYDPTMAPDGGIKDTACVGHEYSFVFTAIVGDSFTLGEITLPLDSMWLDKNTALKGLPKGLNYACDPPTCVFPNSSKGCVIIYGKPETGTEGKHQMTISGKLYADGSSFGLPLTFPDPAIAPGEYAIVVAQKNESPCAKLSIDELKNEIEVFPNPAKEFLIIKSETVSTIEIYNTIGSKVLSHKLLTGENFIDLANLKSGIYFLKSNNNALKGKKLLID